MHPSTAAFSVSVVAGREFFDPGQGRIAGVPPPAADGSGEGESAARALLCLRENQAPDADTGEAPAQAPGAAMGGQPL